MDKRTRSSANMHRTVTLLVDDFNDVLTADPDLTTAEQQRQVLLGRYRENARAAGVQTPATTAAKETEKRRVITEIMKPMGRVGAYGSRTGNTVLHSEMAVSFSKLDDIPDEGVVRELERLMTLMRGVIASVPTVPTAQLDTLDDELDALEPKLGVPRSMIVDRGAEDAAAKRHLKAATAVLDDQHDLIVRSFNHASPATPAEERQKALFDRWARAREIVDAPTTPEDAAPSAGGTPPPNG